MRAFERLPVLEALPAFTGKRPKPVPIQVPFADVAGMSPARLNTFGSVRALGSSMLRELFAHSFADVVAQGFADQFAVIAVVLDALGENGHGYVVHDINFLGWVPSAEAASPGPPSPIPWDSPSANAGVAAVLPSSSGISGGTGDWSGLGL